MKFELLWIFIYILHLNVQPTDGQAEPRKSMDPHAHHRAMGSNVVFSDRRSTMRRIATATTELSTQQSGEAGGTTEDGEEDAAEVGYKRCFCDSSKEQ